MADNDTDDKSGSGYESDSSDISLEMDISCSDSDGEDDSDTEFHDAMDHLLGAGYRFEPDAAERGSSAIEISERRGVEDIVEEEISPDRLLSTEW